MKRFVRFADPETKSPAFGQLENSTISVMDGAPWFGGMPIKRTVSSDGVKLLAPVEPSKIICVGLNYHEHVKASYSADEAPEEPLLFLKPPSSVIGPGEAIIHPPQSERVDYEAELGVVIGKTARNVKRDQAGDYIFGFTCVNDVTARDLQKRDRQWARAKGFDTFCPTGPWVVTDYDYSDVLIEGVQNGKVVQSGRTTQMIFDIPFLIEYISAAMTLLPGDLISTGTPAKIQPMASGDSVAVRIEGIGELENPMA